MTRRDHEPGTPGPTDMTSVPSAAELDETDRYLDRLAAGGRRVAADAGGALLSSAAAPGEESELAGASAFTAALADSVDERRALADEPRTINVLGRVIAAKVAVIAAVATLGIAGAGAATGVILQSVDRETPSTTAPEPTDDLVPGASDGEGASRTPRSEQQRRAEPVRRGGHAACCGLRGGDDRRRPGRADTHGRGARRHSGGVLPGGCRGAAGGAGRERGARRRRGRLDGRHH